MKRALFLSVLLLCSGLAVGQGFTIRRFDVNIDLKANGSMEVTESLQVEFHESKRGIFRSIPVDLETGRGTARRLFLSGISVTDENGAGYTTNETKKGAYLEIRVGDSNIWLPPGTRKTYVFRYRAVGMINWFSANSDWGSPVAELYWNATGHEWEATIERSSVKVSFPKSNPDEGLRARVLVGSYGSTETQALLTKPGQAASGSVATSLTDSQLEIQCERRLDPGEGITFVLDVPEKVIEKPTPWESFVMFILPNLGFSLPLFALVGGIVAYVKHGRDPDGGPMVVQFDPPDDISGPEAGAFIDEKVDQRDLAAGVISLAVKGYLVIHPKEVGLIFKKRAADLTLTRKPAGPDLSPFEHKLLSKLGKCSSPIDETELRTNVAPYLHELKISLYEGLVHRGYYLTSPNTARWTWFLLALLGIAILGAMFTVISPIKDPFPAIIGGILSVIVIGVFTPSMARRTKVGSMALSKVKGFEEFIKRARGDELEWQSKKQPDMALFENYLPHAIAFGLTAEWARAFEGILHEMPRWYASPYGGPFNAMYFSSDLGSITETIGSAASTPPRSSGASGGSSGFGGGGFSGGGFGGGGGGSW